MGTFSGLQQPSFRWRLYFKLSPCFSLRQCLKSRLFYHIEANISNSGCASDWGCVSDGGCISNWAHVSVWGSVSNLGCVLSHWGEYLKFSLCFKLRQCLKSRLCFITLKLIFQIEVVFQTEAVFQMMTATVTRMRRSKRRETLWVLFLSAGTVLIHFLLSHTISMLFANFDQVKKQTLVSATLNCVLKMMMMMVIVQEWIFFFFFFASGSGPEVVWCADLQVVGLNLCCSLYIFNTLRYTNTASQVALPGTVNKTANILMSLSGFMQIRCGGGS